MYSTLVHVLEAHVNMAGCSSGLVTRNGLYERGHDKDFLFNEYTALVCGVP